ncbi:MAG: competence/damage-inducible protein A [Candidatus Omnitrophica bacterium]|nr:competence/damage-inducible protein A [Candidatus Omnitrophota bacterium]
MRAEIIAIGTELLLGYTVNDDAATVGRALARLGIDCYRHVTVGDNPARLAEAIRTGLQRADLVVTCGGLGPTVDDVTLETISAVTGHPLVFYPEILRKIRERFRRLKIRMPPSNRRQALLPKEAVELPNAIGTAPGFLLTLRQAQGKRKFLAALPGPPSELIPMLEKHLEPRLRRLAGAGVLRSLTLETTGLTESEVDAKVRDLLALAGDVTVGIYARAGQVDLRITARAGNTSAADRKIRRVERRIRQRLGKFIYGADQEQLEEVVGRLLQRRRRTLAVAESCTGGLIQHRITEVPGSSDYFVGGVVSYANKFKTSALSVRPSLLRKHGAVSRQVAATMADEVRGLTGSDLGLAVTGIAGPTGGTKTKPVGLVYIALAAKRSVQVQKFLFSGSRGTIKFKTSQAALNLVRLHLLK